MKFENLVLRYTVRPDWCNSSSFLYRAVVQSSYRNPLTPGISWQRRSDITHHRPHLHHHFSEFFFHLSEFTINIPKKWTPESGHDTGARKMTRKLIAQIGVSRNILVRIRVIRRVSRDFPVGVKVGIERYLRFVRPPGNVIPKID